MKVVYTDKPGNERGVCYRTKFLGVITGAAEVEIDGDFPGVAEAYERAGIRVGGKTDPVTGEGDPHKMNMPELKDWLTEQGIEFDAGAKKADLQALIPDPVTGEGDEKEDED